MPKKKLPEKNKKETNISTKKKKKSFLNVDIGGVPVLDVVLSIRHLSIMLKSSMPLADAIEVLTIQTNNEKLKSTYAEIHSDVVSGQNLADAMRKYPKIFNHVTVSVIDVGEQGGTLESNLIFLADFLKQNYELNRKVKGALVYPMIVFGLTAVEMLGVMFFIIPQLDSLFKSFDNIPAFTRFIMDLSFFIRENWMLCIAITIVVAGAMTSFLKTKMGKKTKDQFALNFPIIKTLNQKHILTNYSRTLAILLESSIPITECLKISAETVENYIFRRAAEDVHRKVSEGTNLATAMRDNPKEFPATFMKMVEVGEETGTLEENLMYLHDFYAEEVTEMSNNLATLLEPILLVFIGIMIGLLAITIISPIYQLTSSINGG
jgi:type IV pilus assembly protein PilC